MSVENEKEIQQLKTGSVNWQTNPTTRTSTHLPDS